ncbi:MAG: T9SS type A sorting domain-containing protein [Marinilabiliaceae bacterium]|nr:T9SS type A sorting domain-containing protein [Marinilabiliaceae bacterium]
MKKIVIYSVIVAFTSLSITVNAQTIRYVTPNGTGNGTSWINAASDIQTMINLSESGDQVWIRYGNYLLEESLEMKAGVQVFGSFFGNETSFNNRPKSDIDLNGTIEPWEFTYATVLDGQNDCRILNQATNFTVETVWDGLTIANGYSEQIGQSAALAGGVYIRENGKLINSIISDNETEGAHSAGGGVYVNLGTIAYCLINENTAGNGGGIYNYSGTVSECMITENSGRSGGGIYNNKGNVINCMISDNFVNYLGGGLYNYGGGIVTNCTVSNNTANMGTSGGGIYNKDGTIIDCTVSENNTLGNGGGIANEGTIFNCIVSANSSENNGGGIYNLTGGIVNDCTVSQNYAKNGGGIYNSYGIISRCTVNNNETSIMGGGVFNTHGSINNCTISWNEILCGDASICYGGGIYNENGSVTNCKTDNNTAKHNGANGESFGGGIYNINGTLTNCLIVSNKVMTNFIGDAYGGGIANGNGTVTNCTVVWNWSYSAVGNGVGGGIHNFNNGTVNNSIIWENSANDGEIGSDGSATTVSYSAIADGYAGEGNIILSLDNMAGGPMFVDPEENVEDNYRLLEGSPCIDAGNNNFVALTNALDLDGNPRVENGIVDMGAYESPNLNTTYSISGKVTHIGNPVAGVTISHTAGHPVLTNSQGEYVIRVNEGSNVTITPILAGFIFTPSSITHTNVTEDITNQNFTIDESGIFDVTHENGTILVYPNPTSGKFSVFSFQFSENSVEIFDITGRKLATFKLDILLTEIDISHLQNGIYFLNIENKTIKIVKN